MKGRKIEGLEVPRKVLESSYTIRSRGDETVPPLVLESLLTHDACQGGHFITSKEAVDHHMGLIYELGGQIPPPHLRSRREFEFSKESAADAVQYERFLLQLGNIYFSQGWRIGKTEKKPFGTAHKIPEAAVEWCLVSAGYIATCEQNRLLYVYRKDHAS